MKSISLKHQIASAVLFAILAVTGNAQADSQNQGTSTLTVHVLHARNAKGKIGVTVFKNADGFPSDSAKATMRQAVDVDPRSLDANVVFKGLPHGVYAVAVLHDENGNGKMDKNLLGIPKEGYGASNNPSKKMRPPTFDEAKFNLAVGEKTIEINLVY